MRSRKNKAKKSVKNGGGFRGIKRFSKTPRKSNLWCVKTGSTLEDDILEYMVKVQKYSDYSLDKSVTWTLTEMFDRLKNSNQFRSWFGLCNNGVIKTDEEIQKIIKHVFEEAAKQKFDAELAAKQKFDAELAADLKKENDLASEAVYNENDF